MKTDAKDKKLIGEEWITWWLKNHRPDLLVNKNYGHKNNKKRIGGFTTEILQRKGRTRRED